MKPNTILVVEDDKNISKLIKYNLEKANYKCIVFKSGEDALKALHKETVDLVILDIMLPNMDGFEVCRQIKKDNKLSEIPIVMLTARGEEMDRIVGLELGADDYIVKPFSPRELILRIKAILKRNEKKEMSEDIISTDNLKIDIAKHEVMLDKKIIDLTRMEFKLLTTLIKRKGRVQTRDVLLDDVWGVEAALTTRTVDTHIKSLRKKMGRFAKLIETVRGIGYRFK